MLTTVATLGENLRRLRETQARDQKEVAAEMGVPQSQLSNWENDRHRTVDASTLLRLAKAYRVHVEDLLEGIDPTYDQIAEELQRATQDAARTIRENRQVLSKHQRDELLVEVQKRRAARDIAGDADVELVDESPEYERESIPVLFEGEATPEGTLSWTPDGTPLWHVEKWGSRPRDIDDPRAYLVIIRGDSMEPAYKRGWRAIVSPNLKVQDGDLVCVHLAGGERLIKIAYKDPAGGWLLESYNPAHRPRFVPDADVSMIHKVAYVRTMK